MRNSPRPPSIAPLLQTEPFGTIHTDERPSTHTGPLIQKNTHLYRNFAACVILALQHLYFKTTDEG